ncbi:ABC transporter ATP-binding protein [Candidatus Korarchaeum cryptofilum]|jgi:branched-chain amino acid transport system ATP-binding protein|uniref:ABC transporter ATP-binding protein n=1 Tax=Candidatus Korarchaeum cryptofilum TaxID=498846 RepID=A0A3R9P911_9CREN|nr:ABC transporter ATP-binding protein [Candidatus Korarchaeum cryptofilum]RSN67229.1 ABC transporter ATP-binding protein [Candidatus Korarchaeum cryptofilum]TDA42299.1 MAG: ABC transporter ATP-binding protein [Candidatus Korarchaeota archaeon]
MLEVESLNSGYGKLHILQDVCLKCEKGEIVALLGPNGAGKSTFFNSIMGLADVFSGSVRLDGEELVGLSTHKIARKGVGYAMQLQGVFADLTTEENLKASAKMAGINYEEVLPEILDYFPDLRRFLKRKALTLSGGERQMLTLSISLIRSPKVLLLDEPTAGLSPLYSTKIIRAIAQINKSRGLSIVLAEQNVRKALEIAHRVYLLVSGRIIFEGTPSDLSSREDLMKLYLGGESK